MPIPRKLVRYLKWELLFVRKRSDKDAISERYRLFCRGPFSYLQDILGEEKRVKKSAEEEGKRSNSQ